MIRHDVEGKRIVFVIRDAWWGEDKCFVIVCDPLH